MPLGFVSFQIAAAIWLVFELACLITILFLLGRLLHIKLSPAWICAIALSSLAWYPVMDDLRHGQFNFVLLLLAVLSIFAVRSDRPLTAGLLLGLALVVKPVTWPLLLVFLIRKHYRVAGISLATLVCGYGVTALVIGLDRVAYYFTHVAPTVSATYRNLAWNQSFWTLFNQRVVDDTIGYMFDTPPKIGALDTVIAGLVPLLVILIVCLATRRQPVEWAIGAMLCVSIVVSPVAWPHYLILGGLSVALIGHWLAHRRFPVVETNAAILAGLLLLIPQPTWHTLALFVGGYAQPEEGERLVLSLLPSYISMGSALATSALCVLTVLLGRKQAWAALDADEVPGRPVIAGPPETWVTEETLAQRSVS
jgi:alpha-1,2-mannosyltransferase